MLRKLLTLTFCCSAFLGCTGSDISSSDEQPVRPGDLNLTPDELQSFIKQRYMERTAGFASKDITGEVRDASGAPLDGVTVRASGLAAMTDESGLFTIKDAPFGDYLLNFEHPDYALVQRGIVVENDRPTYISVQMLKKEPTQSLDIDRGGEIQVGPLSLRFEPGDLVFENTGGTTSDGADEVEVVRGLIDVSIAVFDPRIPGHILASPAPLQGIDATGNVVGLESFGMLGVEMGQNGRSVNVRPGQTVTAKMNIHGIYGDVESGSEIPMWHMDTKRGIWVQEGGNSVVVRENEQLVAVAELPHFSFWNFDRDNKSYCAVIRFPNAATTQVSGIRSVSTYMNSVTADGLWSIEGGCTNTGLCVTNVPARFGGIDVHFKIRVDVGSGNWCDVDFDPTNADMIQVSGYSMYTKAQQQAQMTNRTLPDYTWCGTQPGFNAQGSIVVSDAVSDYNANRPFAIALTASRINEDSCTNATGNTGGRTAALGINTILNHPQDNGYQRMASNANGSYGWDIDRDGIASDQDACPSHSNNAACGPYCYVALGTDPFGWYDYDQDTVDDFCDSSWTTYNRSQYNGL